MKMSGDRDHPLITLVSQGSHYQHTHPPRYHNRKWDVTFAADPGQIDHRNGPSASAGRWCTGQNGGIQCGVAQYEQFERLVGEVRATLVKDLLMGYLNCNSSTVGISRGRLSTRSSAVRAGTVASQFANCWRTACTPAACRT